MATSVLKRGSRGQPVVRWQRALGDAASSDVLAADGVFGPQTEAATRLFQGLAGVRVDGIVGPRTRAAMGGAGFRLSSGLAAWDAVRAAAPRYPWAVVLSPTGSLAQAAIDTRQRLAAWLAQLGHESGGFRYLEEVWGPTRQQRQYEPPSSLASRLGNTEKGDGFRFRGAGPIQLTGRANFRLMGKRLKLPLEDNPDLARTPEVGLASAAEFWTERKLNTYADRDDVEGLTRRINGGLNGLADRVRRWNAARRELGLIV